MSFIADAKQVAPDKPFFLNLCPGATHAPHHVPQEWANRYRGRFDDGWDAYREQTFARQKQLGVVPATHTCPRAIRTCPRGSRCPRRQGDSPRG